MHNYIQVTLNQTLILHDAIEEPFCLTGSIKNLYLNQTLFSKATYSGNTFLLSVCVPWELNPQPLRC